MFDLLYSKFLYVCWFQSDFHIKRFTSKTTGTTSAAVTAFLSGAHVFTLVPCRLHISPSFVFCIFVCGIRLSFFPNFFSPLYCLSVSTCGFWLAPLYLQTFRKHHARPKGETNVQNLQKG